MIKYLSSYNIFNFFMSHFLVNDYIIELNHNSTILLLVKGLSCIIIFIDIFSVLGVLPSVHYLLFNNGRSFFMKHLIVLIVILILLERIIKKRIKKMNINQH